MKKRNYKKIIIYSILILLCLIANIHLWASSQLDSVKFVEAIFELNICFFILFGSISILLYVYDSKDETKYILEEKKQILEKLKNKYKKYINLRKDDET